MNRPLFIVDCDEVILHHLSPFVAWLRESRGIDVNLTARPPNAFVHADDGATVTDCEMVAFSAEFFATQMHRQTPAPHAIAILTELESIGDLVVLTNLGPEYNEGRKAQFAKLGINCPIYHNRGCKGPAVARLIAERRPSCAVFVDDTAYHHVSVAEHCPDVWRLHLIAEPTIAHRVGKSPGAHARIDDWPSARNWVINCL